MGDDGGISRERFFTEYGEAVVHGYAGVFAGAGLSRAAGFVDWKGLLREFADELHLDLEIESDLVAVAQYHLNSQQQNRNRLHQKLVDEFTQAVDVTESHRILARLPIRTFWTSNYDDLVERALTEAGKKVSVKRSGSLTVTAKGALAEVYKLHGDLQDPSTIIITRDDYAAYQAKFPGFRDRLRADLTEKTFLFLGFSFTDPHLDFLLSELKQSFGNDMRNHFVVMRRESRGTRTAKGFRYASNLQRLRIEDLARFGINTLLIDDHDELPAILRQLHQRYLRRQVFVSGAAHTFEPRGREWLEQLTHGLGGALMSNGYNLVSGFGLGLGSPLIAGALEVLYGASDPQIDRRLLLRPFPQAPRNAAKIQRQYRESMLATAGFAIVISGNREAPDGSPELSPGVMEEIEIARSNGCLILPVGSSGWQAEAIWQDMETNFHEWFPPKTPRRPWLTLNARNASPREVTDSLLSLLEHLRPK